MNNAPLKIDLVKLAKHLLKYCWLIIIFAMIGFGWMYYQTAYRTPDTYTASGTMYVYNANPNLVNYQYTSSSDLYSAYKLIDTYLVVVKSDKVMDVVVERLAPDYPNITSSYVASTVSMASVSETGVMQVRCTTNEAQKSADICNAVMDVAPAEIIRVVSAGNVEVIDYASVPTHADGRNPARRGLTGAMAGAVIAAALLLVLFLLNQRVASAKELTDSYTPPVLSSIKRDKRESKDPAAFLLTDKSPMDIIEGYSKLRMNLLYTLVDKENPIVAVTSAVSGEGKSSITANLAVSCAMSGKQVLLIDADMRRGCQRDIFHYSAKSKGLSNVLLGECRWDDALIQKDDDNLYIMPSGSLPPNPAELMGSQEMHRLLKILAEHFDIIILDTPPVNIVSDPLALADQAAGALFVVRQNFTDHREIRKALNAAELTGMEVLGFCFYGESVNTGGYYNRRYYRSYYHNYYYGNNPHSSSNNKSAGKHSKIKED